MKEDPIPPHPYGFHLMSRKEVAEEVGKTEFQVARSLFKSRQKLRPILSSQI